jgi:hypothetical protein
MSDQDLTPTKFTSKTLKIQGDARRLSTPECLSSLWILSFAFHKTFWNISFIYCGKQLIIFTSPLGWIKALVMTSISGKRVSVIYSSQTDSILRSTVLKADEDRESIYIIGQGRISVWWLRFFFLPSQGFASGTAEERYFGVSYYALSILPYSIFKWVKEENTSSKNSWLKTAINS